MISVILSTNNELRNNYLEKLLVAIKQQDSEYELIVVDNGSSDWTVELCERYGKVFHLEWTNRAQRLNYWFFKATWDIILFHHSVSILPQNVFSQIEASIKQWVLWWGLTHSFGSKNTLLRFTSWYSNNIRAKYSSIIYLDHCIFAQSEALVQTGWFPEVDIFEDTLFSYNLSKVAKWIILPYKVITSARRFTKRGIFKQVFINQYLKILFHLKKSDKSMNKLYEESDGFNVKYSKK